MPGIYTYTENDLKKDCITFLMPFGSFALDSLHTSQ